MLVVKVALQIPDPEVSHIPVIALIGVNTVITVTGVILVTPVIAECGKSQAIIIELTNNHLCSLVRFLPFREISTLSFIVHVDSWPHKACSNLDLGQKAGCYCE